MQWVHNRVGLEREAKIEELSVEGRILKDKMAVQCEELSQKQIEIQLHL